MAAEGAKQIKEVKGLLYTAGYEFRPGRIRIEGDRIAEVDFCTKGELSEAERGMLVLPGLVDIHFHGAAGYDFCDGTQEAYRAIEAYENSHGITSICPATMTLPVEQLKQILTEVSEDKPDSLVGVHLEGPFINKAKKGAQKEEYVIPPNAEVLKELQKCAEGLVKLVSIAPETEGAIDCIRELGKEFHFSIAHTMSDYDTAVKAIQAGAKHITHLYNAMPVPTHREPAVVGAAADDPDVMPELICDGIHIHPCMVRNTFRLFGAHRMILISDSMRAVGMEDGQYTLGGQEVTVRGALATLADGTIAGSATNLYDCMCKAVEMGIPKEQAIRAATINPAVSIGASDEVGSLEAGKYANIVIANKELHRRQVILKGVIL